uniref:Polynucleotide adenylyltransferase n=1 Tax=Meloidogyne floridensis TaxID=298350 RepID=A0A915P3W6_9BILA
ETDSSIFHQLQPIEINCSNKKQIKKIAELYINGDDRLEQIQEIHRKNIEELIGVSGSFVEFLRESLSKNKLFHLLGPRNFGEFETEFAEILEIWNMEENYRWYLYKELIGLNYEFINDDLENGENEEIEARSNAEDVNLEIRLAKSLLFKKLIKYEDSLILNLLHANNDMLKIIQQLIENIKYYIYVSLPTTCSLNILVEAINLFENKIFDLVVKGDWDQIIYLLGQSITMKDLNEKDELKERKLLNEKITDPNKFVIEFVNVIEYGGWNARDTEPDIEEFIKWLKIQHLIQIKEFMKKDAYADFRKKLAKKMELVGESRLYDDLSIFIPQDAIFEILELIKKEMPIAKDKNDKKWKNILREWDKKDQAISKKTKINKKGKKTKAKTIVEVNNQDDDNLEDNSNKLIKSDQKECELDNQQNEREKIDRMAENQILDLKNSQDLEESEESEQSLNENNSQNFKKSKRNLQKRINQKARRENKIKNESLVLKENLESFVEKRNLIKLYGEFIKAPSDEMRKQLNIAVYIYEISNRFKWLEDLKNEWPSIYEAMFLLKGENKENKALNKLMEKLNKFKESVLSLNIIENLNEFEINLHKLLKELIYVVEGIWDGRHNGRVDLEEIKIVRKQLNYKMFVESADQDYDQVNDEYYSIWEDIEREHKNKIVGILFDIELKMEQNKIIENVNKYLSDWKMMKNQRFMDNQDIPNYEIPKYIQPELFQQINFDYKSEDITGEELEYLLETQIRDPELVKNCLTSIRSSIMEWSRNIQKKIKLLVGGSYMFGIDTIGADVDLMIVLNENDFDGILKFIGTERSICKDKKCNDNSLYCILCKLDNVKNIQKVNTRIPLIELNYSNIDFDIALILLPTEIPNTPNWIEKVLENEKNLAIGDRKILPLASYKANEFILEKIPKEDLRAKNFRFAIIAMKIWAKESSIYGNIFGFLKPGWIPIRERVDRSDFYNKLINIESREWLDLNINRLYKHMELVIPIISSSFPEQSVGFNINNSTKQIIMETMTLVSG